MARISRLSLALASVTPLLLRAEVPVSSDTAPSRSPGSVVWFDKPAGTLAKPRVAITASGTDTALGREARKIDFHEALPVGNGRLGAMDCGGVDLERIILNESTVWSGGDYDANKHEAHDALPEIRRKLFAGDVAGAKKLLDANFGWVGKRFDATQFGCYQTLGDLLLKSSDDKTPATAYRRELDLTSGVVTTSFVRGGVRFTRELFVSKPDEAILVRMRADKPGAVNLLATLARPAQAKTAVDGDRFVMSGQLTFDPPEGQSGAGVKYRAALAAKTKGGRVVAGPEGLRIENADEVVLVVSAGTDLRDKAFQGVVDRRLDAALAGDFDARLAASVADYRGFMDRCVLSLPEGPDSKLPTPARVKLAQKTPDPALDELYFRFGRHLLVSGSRPDSPLPSNLQGIWAEEVKTPWNGDFHSNINLQMNYWPAEPTGLGDCVAPLFDLIRRTAKNGEVTAKAYYDAPGWMCYHTQNPWGYSAPTNLEAGAGSTCGGWLCQHIWTHYRYTGDTAFLRANYPVMRGACEFFLATLVADPSTGLLVTAPSNSPENNYVLETAGGGRLTTSLTYGATYDMQIIRELFADTAAAARVLGADAALIAKLDAARAKLAPTRVDADGRIMEWIAPYKEADPRHRHVSPLWGLHPGREINRATPALFAGAKKLLERRGDASTGWSMAWKSNFWARLDDGDRSRKLLAMLIGRGAPNLFCLHAPFQIDGNFGGTAAMTEMLLRTVTDEVRLLPALPSAWNEGAVKELRAPGSRTVDIVWRDGALVSATLRGTPGDAFPVSYRDGRTTVTIPAGGAVELTPASFR